MMELLNYWGLIGVWLVETDHLGHYIHELENSLIVEIEPYIYMYNIPSWMFAVLEG